MKTLCQVPAAQNNQSATNASAFPDGSTDDQTPQTLALYIGRTSTGVTIRRDAEWPDMWRVHHRGGVTDMVNLTRAKDAAISYARPRGLGGSEIARWRPADPPTDGSA